MCKNKTGYNLEKNDYLKGKLSVIEKLVDKKDYKEAYYKLAVILEYINVLFVNKVLEISTDKSDVITFCRIYLKYDEKLANKMISINAEYNWVSEDISSINIDDVEYLASNIYDIYNYMITSYHSFL